MSYQHDDQHAMSIPDYALGEEYFDGCEESPLMVDSAAAQMRQIRQFREMSAAAAASIGGAAAWAFPPATHNEEENDALLTGSYGGASRANNRFGLPADYPAPLSESQFRPYPIATGADDSGPFEVFPPSIHPAGRHYHAYREAHSRGSSDPFYRPCPPCVTMDTPHQSTAAFTPAGWIVGICCFPCGILCCRRMTTKSCTRCGSKLEE